jgi:ABC-type multidrug transport system fused ATPase/permease subunit
MDEATASVDPVTQQVIHETMKQCLEDSTVIVIAHRLETLKDMDRVILFDRGSIADVLTAGNKTANQ